MELVITKDNGEIETFNAYRVQHSNSRGPYKGGLRYHPQVDLDDVRRHSNFSLSQHKQPSVTHRYGAGAMLTWHDQMSYRCTEEREARSWPPCQRAPGSLPHKRRRARMALCELAVGWSEAPVCAAWRR